MQIGSHWNTTRAHPAIIIFYYYYAGQKWRSIFPACFPPGIYHLGAYKLLRLGINELAEFYLQPEGCAQTHTGTDTGHDLLPVVIVYNINTTHPAFVCS